MDSRGFSLLAFLFLFFFVLCSFVPLSDFRFGLIRLRFGLIEIKTETKLEINLNDVKGIFNFMLFGN